MEGSSLNDAVRCGSCVGSTRGEWNQELSLAWQNILADLWPTFFLWGVGELMVSRYNMEYTGCCCCCWGLSVICGWWDGGSKSLCAPGVMSFHTTWVSCILGVEQ